MALEGGGLSWSDLQQMEVAEFYDHVALSRHRVAANQFRMMGTIGIFSPHVKQDVRSRTVERLQREQRFGCRLTDDHERLPNNFERVKLIGVALSSKGAPAWRKTRQGREHLEWLEAAGLTEADAIRTCQDWEAEIDARIGRAERTLAAHGRPMVETPSVN